MHAEPANRVQVFFDEPHHAADKEKLAELQRCNAALVEQIRDIAKKNARCQQDVADVVRLVESQEAQADAFSVERRAMILNIRRVRAIERGDRCQADYYHNCLLVLAQWREEIRTKHGV